MFGVSRRDIGMKNRFPILLAAAVVMSWSAVGCDRQNDGVGQTSRGPNANGGISLSPPDMPSKQEASLVTNPDPALLPAGSLLFIHTDIRHYEVPIGKISRCDAFWAALDQNACGSQTAALLRRNGLRVAVGASQSWPALQTLLEEAGALAETFSNQNRSGVTVEYVTNDDRRDLTLFFYDQHHGLRGLDLGQVKTTLLVEQSVDVRTVNMVRFGILPRVRTDQVRRRWAKTADGRFEEQMTYDSLALSDLAFQVAVPYDHFLVIGASESAAVESLAGGRFLTRELGLERKESLFVLMPRVLRFNSEESNQTNTSSAGGV